MKLNPNQHRVIKECTGINPDHLLVIDVQTQTLSHFKQGRMIREYPVSTSQYGVGEVQDSLKTPRGLHRVYRVLGRHGPEGQLFKSRKPAGRISEADMLSTEDYILSRVLCLEGLEEGINRGGKVDSRARYIYIHGTNHEERIGQPVSQGCIRMKIADIMSLTDSFDLLGAACLIQEKSAVGDNR